MNVSLSYPTKFHNINNLLIYRGQRGLVLTRSYRVLVESELDSGGGGRIVFCITMK